MRRMHNYSLEVAVTRTEAAIVIKRNNAARRNMKKWNDACFRTSPSRDSFKIYQQRFRDAKKELKDNVELHREALSVFFGGA